MEHGLSTLFLWFCRPAVNLFLASSRAGRAPMIVAYEPVLRLLADYYQGPEPDRKELRGFLLTGRWEPVPEAGVPPRAHPDPLSRLKTRGPAGDENPVVAEILSDLDGLVAYLRHSMYTAAGFEDYCGQELDRLRRRFLDVEERERGWYLVIRSAHRRGNPRVRSASPDIPVDLEFQRGVAADLVRLRQIRAELLPALSHQVSRRPVVPMATPTAGAREVD